MSQCSWPLMLIRFLRVLRGSGTAPWTGKGQLLNLLSKSNSCSFVIPHAVLLKKTLFIIFLLRLYASGSSVLPAIQFPGVSPQPLLSIKDDKLRADTKSGCSTAVLLPLIRMIKCTASSQSPNAAPAWRHGEEIRFWKYQAYRAGVALIMHTAKSMSKLLFWMPCLIIRFALTYFSYFCV